MLPNVTKTLQYSNQMIFFGIKFFHTIKIYKDSLSNRKTVWLFTVRFVDLNNMIEPR